MYVKHSATVYGHPIYFPQYEQQKQKRLGQKCFREIKTEYSRTKQET